MNDEVSMWAIAILLMVVTGAVNLSGKYQRI
jgi:hypothetical protein